MPKDNSGIASEAVYRCVSREKGREEGAMKIFTGYGAGVYFPLKMLLGTYPGTDVGTGCTKFVE